MDKSKLITLANNVIDRANDKIKQAWFMEKCTDDVTPLYNNLRAIIVYLCRNVSKRNRKVETILGMLKESAFYVNNEDMVSPMNPQEYIKEQLQIIESEETALTLPTKKDLLKSYLEINEINIARNLLSQKEYITIEDETPRELEDEDITNIWSDYSAKNPKNALTHPNTRNLIMSIARDNAYNPMEQVFDELPSWDGQTRFEDLVSRMTGGKYTQTEVEMMKSFCIQAYVLATAKNPPGADYILVLQGKSEGTGKTHFTRLFYLSDYCQRKYGFRSFNEVRDFNPKNKDDQMIATGYFGVELSEFGESAKYSEALKSFITDETDTYRKPYGFLPSTYARRTTYIATVNMEEFLTANANNRRYLVMTVDSDRFIQAFSDFDFLQMWSETKDVANKRIQELEEETKEHKNVIRKPFSLSVEFQTEIVKRNRIFANKLPGEQEMADYIATAKEYPNRYETHWMTLNQFKNPWYDEIFKAFGKYNNHQLGMVCNALGIQKMRKHEGTFYLLPYPKTQQGMSDDEFLRVNDTDNENKIRKLK